jgi:uncharacterized protein (DUF983 family)
MRGRHASATANPHLFDVVEAVDANQWTACMNDVPRARKLGPALLRGWKRRCPACGQGALLKGYLAPVSTCSACGEALGRYHAADFAPYIVTFLVGLVFTPISVFASLSYGDNIWLLSAVVAAALASALWLLPHIKGAAIAMLWAVDVHNA